MVGVFAGFVTANEPVIKSIGFALAVGVFVDAFLVRMTIVPAIMSLLGERAWWLPRWLDRLLPDLDIEGDMYAALELRHHIATRHLTQEQLAAVQPWHCWLVQVCPPQDAQVAPPLPHWVLEVSQGGAPAWTQAVEPWRTTQLWPQPPQSVVLLQRSTSSSLTPSQSSSLLLQTESSVVFPAGDWTQ